MVHPDHAVTVVTKVIADAVDDLDLLLTRGAKRAGRTTRKSYLILSGL